MRLGLWSNRGLKVGLDVNEAQLRGGHSGLTQRDVFQDREVLAVASADADGFEGGGPVVCLLPDVDVRIESDIAIDEIVDLAQLGFIPAQVAGLVEGL